MRIYESDVIPKGKRKRAPLVEVDAKTKIPRVFSGNNDTLNIRGPRDRQSVRISRKLASGMIWQGLN